MYAVLPLIETETLLWAATVYGCNEAAFWPIGTTDILVRAQFDGSVNSEVLPSTGYKTSSPASLSTFAVMNSRPKIE
jgi:hypothetical protein